MTVTADPRRRTCLAWLFGALLCVLPHALTMSWVVDAGMSSSDEARGDAEWVILVEIPLAVIAFALANDFRGRYVRIRTIVRIATVLGALTVVTSALLISRTT